MSNGYISISIGGKERGVKFGMYAAEKIGAKAAAQKGEDLVTSQFAADLIYFGLVNNCVVKQESVDFTYEEVTDWVEEMWFEAEGQKAIGQVIITFNESRPIVKAKEFQAQLQKESKKKKSKSKSTGKR